MTTAHRVKEYQSVLLQNKKKKPKKLKFKIEIKTK